MTESPLAYRQFTLSCESFSTTIAFKSQKIWVVLCVDVTVPIVLVEKEVKHTGHEYIALFIGLPPNIKLDR